MSLAIEVLYNANRLVDIATRRKNNADKQCSYYNEQKRIVASVKSSTPPTITKEITKTIGDQTVRETIYCPNPEYERLCAKLEEISAEYNRAAKRSDYYAKLLNELDKYVSKYSKIKESLENMLKTKEGIIRDLKRSLEDIDKVIKEATDVVYSISKVHITANNKRGYKHIGRLD